MKKNGFTLIEIIAVLLVISLMFAIITPKIIEVIEDSKKEKLASSYESIARTIQNETFFANDEVEYTIINGKISPSLSVESRPNGNGTITLNPDGNIEMMIDSDGYCVYKSYQNSKITVTKGSCDGNLSDYELVLKVGRITNHSIKVISQYYGNGQEYLYRKNSEEFVSNQEINYYTYEDLVYNTTYDLQGKVIEENGTYAISKIKKVTTLNVPNIKITKKVEGRNVYAIIDFTELKEGYSYRYKLDKGNDTNWQEVTNETLTNGKLEVLIPENQTNVTAQILDDKEEATSEDKIIENISSYFVYMDETLYTVTLPTNVENGGLALEKIYPLSSNVGEVCESPCKARYGDIVKVITTPETNYTIDVLTYSEGDTQRSFAPDTFTDEDQTISFVMPRNNTTINLTYKMMTKVLTINPNGGTWNGSSALQTRILVIGTPTDIGAPIRTNYIFAGWKIETENSGTTTEGSTVTIGPNETTVSAIWIPTNQGLRGSGGGVAFSPSTPVDWHVQCNTDTCLYLISANTSDCVYKTIDVTYYNLFYIYYNYNVSDGYGNICLYAGSLGACNSGSSTTTARGQYLGLNVSSLTGPQKLRVCTSSSSTIWVDFTAVNIRQ